MRAPAPKETHRDTHDSTTSPSPSLPPLPTLPEWLRSGIPPSALPIPMLYSRAITGLARPRVRACVLCAMRPSWASKPLARRVNGGGGRTTRKVKKKGSQ